MRRSTVPWLMAATALAACGGPPPSPPPTVAITAPSAGTHADAKPCEEERYVPPPPSSAAPPKLSPLPAIADVPPRRGEAFTVRGAIHALRTPGELAALAPDEIVIEGVIVDENVGRAPRCALHPAGKRDPVGCAPEIPAFWLADDAAPNAPRIRVLGWASRFSEIVEVRRLALGAPSGGKPKAVRRDDLWDVPVPWPLPTSGKRVRVRGTYAPTFAKSPDRVVDEPATGILTYRQLDYL